MKQRVAIARALAVEKINIRKISGTLHCQDSTKRVMN
jgi:ABC-type taurine transport system ATPase subunit